MSSHLLLNETAAASFVFPFLLRTVSGEQAGSERAGGFDSVLSGTVAGYFLLAVYVSREQHYLILLGMRWHTGTAGSVVVLVEP